MPGDILPRALQHSIMCAKMDGDNNDNRTPGEPALPREGFDDPQKLAELRRQARQRMREEEQTASTAATGPYPVAPVYGGPPVRPSESDDKRVNQTVYGAPAFTGDTMPADAAPVAAVYGAPPEAYRRPSPGPAPAPVYGGAPRPMPAPIPSSRILLIAIGIGLAILAAAWIFKHLQ